MKQRLAARPWGQQLLAGRRIVLLPSMASLWGQILNRLLGMFVHHWHSVRHLDQIMPAQALHITAVSSLKGIATSWKKLEEIFTWLFAVMLWNKWHHFDIVGGCPLKSIYCISVGTDHAHTGGTKACLIQIQILNSNFHFPCTGHMDNFCQRIMS